MKANELMTGDWVLIKRTPSCEYPYKICSINNYSILGEDYADWIEVEAGEEINLEDIKPIPLTAEILENNADGGWCNYSDAPSGRAIYHFGKVAIYVEWERYQPYIELHGLGSTFFKDYIPSVHKLQHALRLCGIDKEIVL